MEPSNRLARCARNRVAHDDAGLLWALEKIVAVVSRPRSKDTLDLTEVLPTTAHPDVIHIRDLALYWHNSADTFPLDKLQEDA